MRCHPIAAFTQRIGRRLRPSRMHWSSVLLLLPIFVYADKEREIDGAASRVHRHSEGADSDHHVDHQAILGSKRVASEFDELPADEAKKRLQIMANRMDVNKDGFIDAEELTVWITKSMIELDEEEVEERMKEMDINGDEFVTWEEYIVDSFGEQDISKLDSDDRKLMAEDKSYFKAADLDGDSKLSREELSAFLNPENFKHMHNVLVEVTLWEKDINKDGAIDVKEFLGDMAENPNSEWHKAEKDRFMSVYDKDNDGLLKGDEVRQWLIPDVTIVAKQETEHLIRGADKNGDGKLSIAEIVDEHRLFVGSEATNYGDALHKISHTEL